MQRDASRREIFGGGFGIFVARRGGFKINFPLPSNRAEIQLYVIYFCFLKMGNLGFYLN